MEKKYLFMVLFILTLSPLVINPASAAATWGVEVDKEYNFELLNFSIADTDYTKFVKAQFNIYVKFTELNDTGYTYNVYNATNDELLSTNSTNFEVTTNENGTFILPVGLPVALPLQFDSTDYLKYLGELVNQTSTMFGDFDELLNTTSMSNDTIIAIYSLLDTELLSLKIDLYTPKVEEELITQLTGSLGSGMGFPMQLPTNLTDFKLNLTLSFDAEVGIFNALILKIRSIATDDFGYQSPFNVDIKYAWDKPSEVTPTPTSTSTPTLTETPYPWGIAIMSPIIVAGLLLANKKRKR
ncbi:MAG: hypothetical protein ACTSXD_01465 [Candidatus Heimdallarchaeaceae archaeon]